MSIFGAKNKVTAGDYKDARELRKMANGKWQVAN